MKNYKPVLVVLGTKDDPHVQRVVREIECAGRIAVFVLDYRSDVLFSMALDEVGNIRCAIDGGVLENTYLVWDRTKILAGTDLYIKGDEVSSGYAAQEWRAMYKLIGGLQGDRVVNSLTSRVCMIKPYQQMQASKAGFLVPPTLISNDKAIVRAFQRDCNDLTIMKSLSGGKVAPPSDGNYMPYNVMTMKVTADDIESATPDEIAYCPHFFQKEIDKLHELRVVVVGRQIIAFEIDSQKHKSTKIDWRKGIEVANFRHVHLEEVVMDKIRAFMAGMGLFTGSLDLVVDKKRETWFLECNQDGAWAWLDDIVDGQIARNFAEEISMRLHSVLERMPKNSSGRHSSPASAVPV